MSHAYMLNEQIRPGPRRTAPHRAGPAEIATGICSEGFPLPVYQAHPSGEEDSDGWRAAYLEGALSCPGLTGALECPGCPAQPF